MNPAYKEWKNKQAGGATPVAAAVPMSPNALPIVSNMEDHMQMNEDLGVDVRLAASTDATIEMMQEPEISMGAGMQPDEMVDELGAILGKYEVPMGLMNKRKLSASLHRHANYGSFRYQPKFAPPFLLFSINTDCILFLNV